MAREVCCVFDDRKCPVMNDNVPIETCPLAIEGRLSYDYTGGDVKVPKPKTMCAITYIARVLYNISMDIGRLSVKKSS